MPDLTVVDENGHAVGCPAYNQPTFTLCTCGATESAGLRRSGSAVAEAVPAVSESLWEFRR